MQGHKNLQKVLVVANSHMEQKATKSYERVGDSSTPYIRIFHKTPYIRILHQNHFGNITSIFNKNNVSCSNFNLFERFLEDFF
jgi:hypothetical protein